MSTLPHQASWNMLQTYLEREDSLLAPFAMHSCNSRGRKYPEKSHAYRGPYQRDRDRVLHSAAYRRLADKTQVFTGEMGDYHRTRLTHTLEVASIARTIGRSLRLNEDLIEALALLHDIGHPPYGHAGEDALNECLDAWGGFSHNQYALCLVEELEVRYHEFPGLNLTHEVLQGQTSRIDKESGQCPLLEVQVVDLADSMTYDAHDTDDALALGLLTIEELQETELILETVQRVQDRAGELSGELLRKLVVHELIDLQVGDVLSQGSQWLNNHRPASAAELCESGFRLGPGAAMEKKKKELEAFLYDRVYRHPKLVQERSHGQAQLKTMFKGYQKRPELMRTRFQERVETVGLQRSVAEYLAGMTDRYCSQQFHLHFMDE